MLLTNSDVSAGRIPGEVVELTTTGELGLVISLKGEAVLSDVTIEAHEATETATDATGAVVGAADAIVVEAVASLFLLIRNLL